MKNGVRSVATVKHNIFNGDGDPVNLHWPRDIGEMGWRDFNRRRTAFSHGAQRHDKLHQPASPGAREPGSPGAGRPGRPQSPGAREPGAPEPGARDPGLRAQEPGSAPRGLTRRPEPTARGPEPNSRELKHV